MRLRMKPAFILAVALLATATSLSIAYDVALGKTAPAPAAGQKLLRDLPADSVGEQAAELLAHVNANLREIEHYTALMQNASTEDSIVLRKQLSARQVEAVTVAHELGGVLLEQEKERPQPELRAQVESVFHRISPRLWEHIDRLRRQIDRTRALRPSVGKDDRIALEEELGKRTRALDKVFALSLDHVGKEREIGLDVTQDSTTLSGLLQARADELSGRIDLALERIDDLEARRKDDPDNADIVVQRTAAQRDLANNTTSMKAMLDLMDGLSLTTSVYRAQLVTATRDVTTGMLDADVAKSLASRAWKNITKWFSTQGPRWGLKLLIFAVILLVARLVGKLVSAVVDRGLRGTGDNFSRLLRRMIVRLAGHAVVAFGLVVALAQIGVSLGPLLAGVGVVGFILGFALQDTLSNFAAGMMILFYRPYDVGDAIEVAGVAGKVDQMSLVSTSILTADNQLLVVPNGKIWGGVIKNETAKPTRRVDLAFGISYRDDIGRAERVLVDILDKQPKVLRDPAPIVKLHKLGEYSVDFVVRPWVNAADYWDVYWDVTRAVKSRFEEEGISTPIPQRDVNVSERSSRSLAAKPAGSA